MLAVNPDALSERGGRTVLFVVREGRAEEVAVTRGAKLGDLAEIAGAVKAGDKVVAKPTDAIQAGVAVKLETNPR